MICHVSKLSQTAGARHQAFVVVRRLNVRITKPSIRRVSELAQDEQQEFFESIWISKVRAVSRAIFKAVGNKNFGG
jgi:hypothetical protein